MNQTFRLRFRLKNGQPVIENWQSMDGLFARLQELFKRNGSFPFSVTIITEESV